MAAGLCSWVRNVVVYHDILENVQPKRAALAEANDKLSQSTLKLRLVKEKLVNLERELVVQTTKHVAAIKAAEESAEEVAKATSKVSIARRLLGTLLRTLHKREYVGSPCNLALHRVVRVRHVQRHLLTKRCAGRAVWSPLTSNGRHSRATF